MKSVVIEEGLAHFCPNHGKSDTNVIKVSAVIHKKPLSGTHFNNNHKKGSGEPRVTINLSFESCGYVLYYEIIVINSTLLNTLNAN